MVPALPSAGGAGGLWADDWEHLEVLYSSELLLPTSLSKPNHIQATLVLLSHVGSHPFLPLNERREL